MGTRTNAPTYRILHEILQFAKVFRGAIARARGACPRNAVSAAGVGFPTIRAIKNFD